MGSTTKQRWVTGGVLAGLIFALWYYWPSGVDARFVGKWRIGTTPYVYKLAADGTFTYEIDGKAVRWTQWRVRNDTFYYTTRKNQGWELVRAWIDRIRFGQAKAEHIFKVLRITPDALVFGEGRGEMILLRVPDDFVPPETKPGFQISEQMDEVDKAHEARLRAIDPKRYARD